MLHLDPPSRTLQSSTYFLHDEHRPCPSHENATGDRPHVRAKRLAFELTPWPEKRIGPIDMTDVTLKRPNPGTPKALKGDLLA